LRRSAEQKPKKEPKIRNGIRDGKVGPKAIYSKEHPAPNKLDKKYVLLIPSLLIS
jgi:hypothetical protein